MTSIAANVKPVPAAGAVAECQADLRLTISPEPTDDERDAVVAALAALLTRPSEPDEGPAEREPTPWMRAACEEAVRGLSDFDRWRRAR